MLVNFAKKDEHVRLITLEGSRSRANVIRDAFQDYDVSYFVSDMAGFEANDEWLDYFGPRLIMQKPEAPFEKGLSYLMLFEDGSRIDLFVLPLSEWEHYLRAEASVRVLLDKDQRLQGTPKAQEAMYHTYLPAAEEFAKACNEFWWVSTYVVKGLCRGEYLYATAHFEQIVRQELLKMLAWRAVYQTGHALDLGKTYKYLPNFLDEGSAWRLQSTYDLSNELSIWQALLTSQVLYLEVSQELAGALDYPFSLSEVKNVRHYTQIYYEGGRL